MLTSTSIATVRLTGAERKKEGSESRRTYNSGPLQKPFFFLNFILPFFIFVVCLSWASLRSVDNWFILFVCVLCVLGWAVCVCVCGGGVLRTLLVIGYRSGERGYGPFKEPLFISGLLIDCEH